MKHGASRPRVALETTLLVHGVPREESLPLAGALFETVRARGAEPALVGVFAGRAVVGLSEAQLREVLGSGGVPKVNAANLGACLHRGGHGATTVSATLELAAAAGVRVFATGGLGGVHRGGALDISADLFALTRFPLAVVCSGVKSILDVEATRELIEALGVCVVGFRTDRFPAFYLRGSAAGVDERFDDAGDLGAFLARELPRARRAVVVCNPVPQEHEVSPADWERWLAEAQGRAGGAGAAPAGRPGRSVTPALLAALHEASAGATLRANVELAKANAALGAELAVAMAR